MDVVKFNPQQLTQKLKDKIKDTFIELIPDEEWNKLVESEVNEFFNQSTKLGIAERDRYKEGSWTSTRYSQLESDMSPFRAIVWEMCSEKTVCLLKDKLTKEYVSDLSKIDDMDSREDMQEFMANAAATAAIKFFKGIVQSSSFELMNQIQNQRAY